MARIRLSSGSERLEGISFLGVGQHIEDRLRQVIEQLTKEMKGEAERNLSGGALKSRSGKLLRSLKEKLIHRSGVRITGVVVQGGRAHYGAFWERGHKRHGPGPGPADKVEAKKPFLKTIIEARRGDVRSKLQHVVQQAARSA